MSYHPSQGPESQQSKWLYLPMEIVERELNGYLHLAAEAVSQGWRCVIARKKDIFSRAEYLPDGVMFLKSIVSSELPMLKHLKSCGHRLVTLDVEGLVYPSIDRFVTLRFTPDTVLEPEKILFWGDIQRKAVEEAYPHIADQCITTGSPIADLWQDAGLHRFYEDEVRALQDEYGPYIFLPSSFGHVNHFMGATGNTDIIKRDKMVAEDQKDAFFKNMKASEKHAYGIFEGLLRMLPDLSKAFPDYRIIVRPHPSEAHERWIEAAQGLDNVKVIFKGPVSPWLLASRAVLHWNCTTGLEGYLMGRPVVCFNPATQAERDIYDNKLPNEVSIQTTTVEETIAALRDVSAAPEGWTGRYPEVRKGSAALKNWARPIDDGLAAERIITELNTLEVEKCPVPETFEDPPVPVKEHIWRILGVMGQVLFINKVMPKRIQHGLKSRAYGQHKSRPIDGAHVERSIQKLSGIRGIEGIRAEKIKANMFLIERK